VIASIDTIVKFLKNDKKYKPLQATVMGCGGTGKSFISNAIISIVRNMTQMNDTVKVGAPSGADAYNVQGSTLHCLLVINVSRPDDKLTSAVLENMQECLKHLLCLIIDEWSMLSSKVLAAAERNVRHSVYIGQYSGEIWSGVPVVLLFGDDYQLFPVIKEGAIQGYSKRKKKCHKHQQQKCPHHTYFVKKEVISSQMLCLKLYSHWTKITESKAKSSVTSLEGYALGNQHNEMQK
jgi:hypothetical protein